MSGMFLRRASWGLVGLLAVTVPFAISTRLRGQQVQFKIESAGAGVAWQLGVMRIDSRPDGRK